MLISYITVNDPTMNIEKKNTISLVNKKNATVYILDISSNDIPGSSESILGAFENWSKAHEGHHHHYECLLRTHAHTQWCRVGCQNASSAVRIY